MTFFRPYNQGTSENRYVYKCTHYPVSELTNLDQIKHQICEDLYTSKISEQEIRNKLILIDTTGEGWSEANILPIVNELTNYTDICNIKALFGSYIKTNHMPFQAISLPLYLASHRNEILYTELKNTKPKDISHKFLCLARRPNLVRAKTISKLLDITTSAQVSFSSGDPVAGKLYQPYFSNHQVPLILDDPHVSQVGSQYFNNGSASMFNIVIETSSQHDLGWSTIFFTEKTFKTFYDFQIPLWVATPGTVNALRTFGFDVFDDIVNHNYDSIINEDERINAVMNEVARLDLSHSIEQLQLFRKPGSTIRKRLDNNFLLLKEYASSVKDDERIAFEHLLK